MTTPAPDPDRPDHDRPDPDDRLAAAAAGVLDATRDVMSAAEHRVLRLEPRLHRLLGALADLGLDDIVGSGWVTITETGEFAFGGLTARAFDRLVRRLEDIASGRRDPIPRPGAGQQPFDFGAARGPSAPATSSSVHPPVAR